MSLSALRLPSLALCTTGLISLASAPAAALAGGVIDGAALGSATANSQYQFAWYDRRDHRHDGVMPAQSVRISSSACYLTHRWINGVRHRVRVCEYRAAP
jgi:hypothetical protein